MKRLAIWVTVISIFTFFISESFASEVISLTDATFDSTIESVPFVLVKFFAPWCGHCRNMAQDYEDLAKAYKHHSKSLKIAELNGDDNPENTQKHNIEGYPTLYLFKRGSSPVSLPDTTPRSFEGLSEFLHQETGLKVSPRLSSSSVTVLSSDNFDSTIKNKCSFVKFYTQWCSHCKNLAPVYEKLSNAFKAEPSVVIAKVDCESAPDIGSKFSVTGYPTLKLFKDSKSEDYKGSRGLSELVSYVNSKCGTHRTVDGSLSETFARSKDLDDLVTKFMKSTKTEERKGFLSQVDALLKKLPHPEYTKFYSTYMTRILDQGVQYAKTELERIEGMLSRPEALADSKSLDSFTVRKYILKLFNGQLSFITDKPDHEEL